jgi:hypothetical protein
VVYRSVRVQCFSLTFYFHCFVEVLGVPPAGPPSVVSESESDPRARVRGAVCFRAVLCIAVECSVVWCGTALSRPSFTVTVLAVLCFCIYDYWIHVAPLVTSTDDLPLRL